MSSSETQENVVACVLRAWAWQAAVAMKTLSASRVKMVSISKPKQCVFCKYGDFIIDEHRFKSLTGVSFSNFEGLSACWSCARCPMGIPELAPCTPTQDTQCDCGEQFFLWRDGNSTSGLCAACTLCGQGSGVVRPCGPLGNTVCEQCKPGTYSKERSNRKPCIPCSRCSDDEVEIRACQPDSDTVCMGEWSLHILHVCGHFLQSMHI